MPRASPSDRGASAFEYGTVLLLVAAIVGAVLVTGVPDQVADLFRTALNGDLGEASNPGSDEQGWNHQEPDSNDQGPPPGHPAGVPPEADPHHPDYQGPPPGHPAGPPEGPAPVGPDPRNADRDTVQEAVDDLEGCLEQWSEDAPWFTGSCSWDIYQDLSPEELAAVVQTMPAEDLRRIFESGPLPLEQEYFDHINEILQTQSLETIRALQNSGATPFAQPAFDDVRGDPAASNSPGNLTYGELDEYSLYEDGDEPVSWEHIDQNSLGDCALMATMGAMATQNPELVEEMIQENPNGTYTVTFPGKEPITVTPDIPLNPDGTPAFAGSLDYPPVIWPAILEKAYADMKGNDYSNLENTHSGVSMDTFAGGAGMDIIPDVTDTTMDELADKFENGEAMTFSTPLEGWASNEDKWDLVDDEDGTLASGHVYFMTGVDRENGTVTLRNPWGPHTSSIKLSIDEVNDNIAAIHSTDLDA